MVTTFIGIHFVCVYLMNCGINRFVQAKSSLAISDIESLAKAALNIILMSSDSLYIQVHFLIFHVSHVVWLSLLMSAVISFLNNWVSPFFTLVYMNFYRMALIYGLFVCNNTSLIFNILYILFVIQIWQCMSLLK